MSIINATPLLAAAGGDYQISRSVRLRSSASAYLNRTSVASPTNNKIFTISQWVKRGTINDPSVFETMWGGAPSQQDTFGFGQTTNNAGDNIEIRDANVGSYNLITTQVFRDPSSWYHLVLAVDTTQVTAANRVKLYVNGTQVTSFSTATYPAQNYVFEWNTASTASVIGRRSSGSSSWYFDGYLTEINFIDGQALTPSSFGQYNAYGVWTPTKYNGTYGNNGFYLNFSDNSGSTATTIGKDSSGNGNNWTPNNISVTAGTTYDSMIDVPTLWGDGGNGRGNYAVLNPVDGGIVRTTISNANLSALFTGTAAGAGIRASGFQLPTSGKWYAEFTLVAKPTLANASTVGISRADTILNTTGNWYIGTSANDFAWSWGTGFSNKVNNNTGSAYGTAPVVGDVIGIAVDLDTNPGAFTLTFYNNGTSQGAAWTNQSMGGQTFAFGCSGTDNTNFAANFGQRPFSYTPPSGFKALNTQNLPEPTIKKGNQYFDTTLRTTVGGTGGSVSSLSFQPDFLWSKLRNTTSGNVLWDSARGVANYLVSNTTAAEATAATWLTSFNSNGYTYGTGDFTSGNSAVDWAWKKGATQGFDIVTFTNTASSASFNHSLGVTPAMIILKGRGPTAANWSVFHRSLANMTSAFLGLNTTSAAGTLGTAVPAPTSTTFGSSSAAIPASENSVAYLFAEVAGFSKFGSYTGNGSADGPFVYCGFRPRWVLVKKTNATSNWSILDTARDDFNVADNPLLPNLSNAESTSTSTSGAFADILSNGFKARGNSGDINDSGATYIFAAFAENPFKNALAR